MNKTMVHYYILKKSVFNVIMGITTCCSRFWDKVTINIASLSSNGWWFFWRNHNSASLFSDLIWELLRYVVPFWHCFAPSKLLSLLGATLVIWDPGITDFGSYGYLVFSVLLPTVLLLVLCEYWHLLVWVRWCQIG